MMPECDVACASCLGGFQQRPPPGSRAGKTVERQFFRSIQPTLDFDHLQPPRPQPQPRAFGKLVRGTVGVQTNVDGRNFQRSLQAAVMLAYQVRHSETVDPTRDRKHQTLALGKHRPSARGPSELSEEASRAALQLPRRRGISRRHLAFCRRLLPLLLPTNTARSLAPRILSGSQRRESG